MTLHGVVEKRNIKYVANFEIFGRLLNATEAPDVYTTITIGPDGCLRHTEESSTPSDHNQCPCVVLTCQSFYIFL